MPVRWLMYLIGRFVVPLFAREPACQYLCLCLLHSSVSRIFVSACLFVCVRLYVCLSDRMLAQTSLHVCACLIARLFLFAFTIIRFVVQPICVRLYLCTYAARGSSVSINISEVFLAGSALPSYLFCYLPSLPRSCHISQIALAGHV